eukprot:1186170-Prorocentrum_minimum.AAC.2
MLSSPAIGSRSGRMLSSLARLAPALGVCSPPSRDLAPALGIRSPLARLAPALGVCSPPSRDWLPLTQFPWKYALLTPPLSLSTSPEKIESPHACVSIHACATSRPPSPGPSPIANPNWASSSFTSGIPSRSAFSVPSDMVANTSPSSLGSSWVSANPAVTWMSGVTDLLVQSVPTREFREPIAV